MVSYENMSAPDLQAEYDAVLQRYKAFQARGMKLNMSRGVPCKSQLDLSQEVLTELKSPEDYIVDGVDTRSYGIADGLPCAKALFAELAEVSPDRVIVGGNSSLNMMYDMMLRSMCFGVRGNTPWMLQPGRKWICVVPGYDRHFAICEQMGIEMLPVEMIAGGPDMDQVEALVRDPAVKGIWCIPKYSNPDGTTYSAETVERLASLKPAAPDFRIYWDNAYCIHDLYDEGDVLVNIMERCAANGNPNLVFEFMSTSKISFPGSGVACMVAGPEDIAWVKKVLAIQTICPDKTNQLRHVHYFKNLDGMKAKMKEHAAICRPKFDAVLERLETEAEGLSFVRWSKPKGGYFISLWVLPGTAKRTVELAANAGVILTQAGATWPYHKDPHDNNIRIAPTNPTLEDISAAAELLCVAFKLAALEKLLRK